MNLLVLHPDDNVAVALSAMEAGAAGVTHEGEVIVASTDIPASHKVARVDIAQGAEIVKYGEVVAIAKVDIRRGDWVHTHNLESGEWKR